MFGKIWELLHEHVVDTQGQISSDCLLKLTPAARNAVVDLIQQVWDEWDEDDED
jgi:capsid protein